VAIEHPSFIFMYRVFKIAPPEHLAKNMRLLCWDNGWTAVTADERRTAQFH
jgi:hypothetical protein